MSAAPKSRPNRFFARRVRTPLFPQLEVAECGAACLGAVLAHFGRWESLDDLREACGVSRDGSTVADIVRAAKSYGLSAAGWRKDIGQLRAMPVPMILFWEFNHYVVLEGVGRGRWFMNDPGNGRRIVGEETFSRGYTGIAITLEPGPGFRAAGARPSVARRLWPWLRDIKGALAFIALCGLLLALPGLALPILLSVFVDHVLTRSTSSWGLALVAAAAVVGGVTYLLTWMQQRGLRKLSIRISIIYADRLLTRLLRLPARYFSHRFPGDLTSRVQLVDEVARGSSSQLIGITIELVMSSLFLALMIVYDPLLAAFVAAFGAANVFVMRAVSRLRNDENRQLRREQALLFSTGTSGLSNMDSLLATATEDAFFARCTGYQARELVARQKFAEYGHVIAALPGLMLVLGSTAVLGFGGWRVMSGDMTLGALMGFYLLAGNFLRPIGNFVQFADGLQILEADLQRIDDVLGAAEDPALAPPENAGSTAIATFRGRLRLAGRVELRNVTFGYRPNQPPLIDGLNLKVEPGQRVAIVGPTASGKSTLLKLVNGEYAPWSGEILFDGAPRSEIPRRVLTDSISLVDQQIFLFAASVRDNLTMWNSTVPESQLIAAARDALIHDEIMDRPRGYGSMVEEGGRNFSGGQRQRLEICRALVNNPAVLFLDEATSSLDAISEQRIDDALRRRGCTCVIVAHRLSTIRDCDLIVVVDKGKEVQRGTHEELVANDQGVYSQFIQGN